MFIALQLLTSRVFIVWCVTSKKLRLYLKRSKGIMKALCQTRAM